MLCPILLVKVACRKKWNLFSFKMHGTIYPQILRILHFESFYLESLYFEYPAFEYPDFVSLIVEYPEFESPWTWIHKIDYSKWTNFQSNGISKEWGFNVMGIKNISFKILNMQPIFNILGIQIKGDSKYGYSNSRDSK